MSISKLRRHPGSPSCDPDRFDACGSAGSATRNAVGTGEHSHQGVSAMFPTCSGDGTTPRCRISDTSAPRIRASIGRRNWQKQGRVSTADDYGAAMQVHQYLLGEWLQLRL